MSKSRLQLSGLALLLLLCMSHMQGVMGKIASHHHHHSENAISVENNPSDVIGYAKDSVDAYTQILEAREMAQLAQRIAGLKMLSGYLGIAGALVGFIFSFFGGSGPDPEILKLQQMIKETQTLITLGNQEILNAIRRLNS